MKKPKRGRGPGGQVKRKYKSGSDKDPRYKSARWTKLSASTRAERQYCECPVCIKSDRPKRSKVLDHTIPVTEGGSFWDTRNHKPYAQSCHNKKSKAEQSGCKTPYKLNEFKEKIPLAA